MIRFSTQWEIDNILIEISAGKIIENAVKYYFSPWITKNLKKTNNKIIVTVQLNKKFTLFHNNLISYERNVSNQSFLTKITINNYFIVLLKNIHKCIKPNRKVIGLNELVMLIVRKGVFEPIEYLLAKNKFVLLHASGIISKNRGVIFLGDSKQGKSTLFNYLYKYNLADKYLGDNYVFSNGHKMLTIPEPQRFGRPYRFRPSYYGRNSSHLTNIYESNVDSIVLLRRGKENILHDIKKETLQKEITNIYLRTQEGISFLKSSDELKEEYTDLQYFPNRILSLSIKNGIHNYKYLHTVIERITKND